MERSEEELRQWLEGECRGYDSINIAGAGKFGRLLSGTLQDHERTASFRLCFLVSSLTDNPDTVGGVTVREITDPETKRDALTFISVKSVIEARKLLGLLVSEGYRNIRLLPGWVLKELEFIKIRQFFEKTDPSCRVMKSNDPSSNYVNLSFDPTPQNGLKVRPELRVPLDQGFNELIFKGGGQPEKQDYLGFFRDYYGEYVSFSDICRRFEEQGLRNGDGADVCASGRVRIYTVKSHADPYEIQCELPEYVVPIQAGAALTRRKICSLTDDTGDNISELNADFSEGTALYWIWKNERTAEYVGMYHHRRHMDLPENGIETVLSGAVDIIQTSPVLLSRPVPDFFCPLMIAETDWELMERSIVKHFPEYRKTMEKYRSARCYPATNICIMKRDLFDEYCSFCFTVLMETASFYKERNILRNDRYAGYLLENLTAMYIMHNHAKYRIAYTGIRFLE